MEISDLQEITIEGEEWTKVKVLLKANDEKKLKFSKKVKELIAKEGRKIPRMDLSHIFYSLGNHFLAAFVAQTDKICGEKNSIDEDVLFESVVDALRIDFKEKVNSLHE